MNNTLYNDEMLLQSKLKSANYGDIVSIYSETLDEVLCKRVIGKEGDRVTIIGDKVYVNDELLDEPYAYYDYVPQIEYDFIVDDDCVFVMGDNRNHSTDSRYLGSLPISNIKSVYLVNVSNIIHANYSTARRVLIILWVILFVLWILSFNNFKDKVDKRNEQIKVIGESK